MNIPILQGVIDRRILVNYRVDPQVLARVLPAPFRPQLIRGVGLAGICLIRLKQIRPRWLPGWLGISSENAAHRIAVEWEQGGETRQGIYVPRRDTSSRWNTWAGGRVFPGVHHRATFQVHEQDDQYDITLDSSDQTHVAVSARATAEFPSGLLKKGTGSARKGESLHDHAAGKVPVPFVQQAASGSIFSSLEEASAFFECGSLGYSATARAGEFDGLELRTFDWQVQPLAVSRVESSFFENPASFPAGSITFDCALLMRNIAHQWHGRERLRACAS